MQPFPYENVVFSDPELPVIFHLDSLRVDRSFNIHWHDSLEVLHFVEGEAEVMSDTVRQKISVGEFAVINSNHIHEVRALTPVCRNYCMLADREFCEQLGAPIGELIFRLRVSDDTAREYFDMIVDEMLTRSAYYKPAVRADLGGFLVHLCRHWLESRSFESGRKDNRLDMVKAAIRYIQLHLADDLTVEKISAAAGFSKYYFCRGFKEITGRTVIDYLNYTRCSYARKLLASGRYNVSESAEHSGFSNLSYFAKTYKKYMGELPSQVERKPKK